MAPPKYRKDGGLWWEVFTSKADRFPENCLILCKEEEGQLTYQSISGWPRYFCCTFSFGTGYFELYEIYFFCHLSLCTTLRLQWKSFSLKAGNDIVTFLRRQYSPNWFDLSSHLFCPILMEKQVNTHLFVLSALCSTKQRKPQDVKV